MVILPLITASQPVYFRYSSASCKEETPPLAMKGTLMYSLKGKAEIKNAEEEINDYNRKR